MDLEFSRFAAQWANIGIVLSMLFVTASTLWWFWQRWASRAHRPISSSSKHAAIGMLCWSVGTVERIGYWVLALALVDQFEYHCDAQMQACELVLEHYPQWAYDWRALMLIGMLGIVAGSSILLATLDARGCRWATKVTLWIVILSAILAAWTV